MKTKQNGRYDRSAEEFAKDFILDNNYEEAFYVVDIDDIVGKHNLWSTNLPRVKPFYAIKCNPNPVVLELLSTLGVGFDCASKREIDAVLDLGITPDQIIYANPCKSKAFIRHAAEVGVDLLTFDNELELYKVKECHPSARLLIRIRVDDSHSTTRLGLKFGAKIENIEHILQTAKELGLNVVGCSFHVGSGCQRAQDYTAAIGDAQHVFELARQLGYKMTILNIGGGFPGTSNTAVSFEYIAKAVREALEINFPVVDNNNGNESEVTIIAEPGRFYVASAFTLVTNIIAKKVIQNEGQTMSLMYYLNDGVYGSFICTVFDHRLVEPKPLLDNRSLTHRGSYVTTIWGPTCDSMDCVRKDVVLPEMHIGEWLLFEEMGAYTVCAGSEFNGFSMPTFKCHVLNSTMKMLQNLPNSNRLTNLLETN